MFECFRQNSSSAVQVIQNLDSGCLPSSELTQPQTSTVLPFRINPNFYTETPEHQLMGISHTITPAVPTFPLSQTSIGGALVVDEDYDSIE